MFFIAAAMIEVGSLTGAKSVVREVGPAVGLVNSLGCVFAFPALLIMIKLGQRFYRHGFGEYSRMIAGTIVGGILSAVLVIYWMFVTAHVVRNFSDFTKQILLEKTPNIVISLSFLLIAAYIAWYGIEPLSRISILMCISIVPAITLMYFTAIPHIKIENFLPFLPEGVRPILKMSFKQIGDLEEMTFLLILIPFMRKPKNVMKAALGGIFIIWIFGIVIIQTLTVGILGADVVTTRLMPPISALETVSVPGLFLEHLGQVFLALWLAIAFPTVAGLLFTSALVLSQIFKTKRYQPFILPLVVAIYIISSIPKNTIEVEKFFEFLTPLGIVVLVFVPLFLYIIALIRGIKDS